MHTIHSSLTETIFLVASSLSPSKQAQLFPAQHLFQPCSAQDPSQALPGPSAGPGAAPGVAEWLCQAGGALGGCGRALLQPLVALRAEGGRMAPRGCSSKGRATGDNWGRTGKVWGRLPWQRVPHLEFLSYPLRTCPFSLADPLDPELSSHPPVPSELSLVLGLPQPEPLAPSAPPCTFGCAPVASVCPLVLTEPLQDPPHTLPLSLRSLPWPSVHTKGGPARGQCRSVGHSPTTGLLHVPGTAFRSLQSTQGPS